MPVDTPAPRRPLFVALGIAVLALLVYWQWPAASPAGSSSNPSKDARTQATAGTTPSSLQVRLGELKVPPPAPDTMDRNPFRFQPKPPPPPAPMPGSGSPSGRGARGAAPPQAMGPPPLPPIPLKFIGRLDSGSTGIVALFSDGRGLHPRGREGDIILGQYRIVHIGIESIVMEYIDGRGRQTIPLTGQGG